MAKKQSSIEKLDKEIAEIGGEKSGVDIAVLDMISDFEKRLDSKEIHGKEINELIDRLNGLKKTYKELCAEYNLKHRAVTFLNAEMIQKQTQIENLKLEYEKQFKDEVAKNKVKSERLDKQISECDNERTSLEKLAKSLKEREGLVSDKEKALAEKELSLDSDYQLRFSDVETQRANVERESKKLKAIKEQSDEALKKLDAKQVEIRKEQTKASELAQKAIAEHEKLKSTIDSINAERERLKAETLKQEQSIGLMRKKYADQVLAVEARENILKEKYLELEVLESRVNKLIKKHQLQKELEQNKKE